MCSLNKCPKGEFGAEVPNGPNQPNAQSITPHAFRFFSTTRSQSRSLFAIFASSLRFAIFDRPSADFGPVDLPPCNRHRPFFLLAGRWHAVPRRVLAPYRWPGHSGPNPHTIPMVTLSFASISMPRSRGIIIPQISPLHGRDPGKCTEKY